MGADMLLACIGEPPRGKGVELNWKAGHGVIQRLTTDELESDPELEWRSDEETVEGRRQYLHDQLTQLQECLEGHRRDVTSWKAFGWWLHFTGGMSSGDDPTDAFDAFSFWGSIADSRKIFNAIGLDWPPTEIQPFTIEEGLPT